MVFFDASGKRWTRIKRSATGLVLLGVIVVSGLVVGVLNYQPKWGTLVFPQQTAAATKPTQTPVQHLLHLFGTSTPQKPSSTASTTAKTAQNSATLPRVTTAAYSQTPTSTSSSSTSASATTSPGTTTSPTSTTPTTTTSSSPTTSTTTHGNSTYGQSHKTSTTTPTH